MCIAFDACDDRGHMRIALGVEYDGAPFKGWQSQVGVDTVQDSLEIALAKLANHFVRTHAAGRTDTGVHALMQVVHFDTSTSRPMTAWVRGVNAHLPLGVRVLWAVEVSMDFHARFSAEARSYQYLLHHHAIASAVLAGKVGWYHAPLDVAAMQEADSYLLGERDFSAVRAADCQAKSPIKLMHQAHLKKVADTIIFAFSANAFLHHQVRNMVGALVYIGKGNYPPSFMQTLLEAKDRTISPPTFSPAGLYLIGVKYASHWGLPETQRELNLFATTD